MELLDIRNINGKKTGVVKERELVHSQGLLHGTVHVWLVRKKDKKKFDILLQKRAATKDSYPGYYDISCAGHVPSGEEFEDSAVRELKEELGLDIPVEKLRFIGFREGMKENIFRGKPFIDHEISAVYYIEYDMPENEFKVGTDEVESVKWIDYELCLKQIRNEQLQCCLFTDELKMLAKAIRK